MSAPKEPVVILLRGINVVGNNRLPMKDLARILRELGLEDAETYIASGNAVASVSRGAAGSLAEDLSAAIEKEHGFRPWVLVVGASSLRAAIRANPFHEADDEPRSLHLYFLAGPAAEDGLERLAEVAAENERFHLAGEVFYLYAPDGIGRSKLAAAVEKRLGVAATARNWRTARKLLEMVEARSGTRA